MQDADNNVEEVSRPEVGFPEPTKSKRKFKGSLILILLALVIAGFFGYSVFFAKESTDKIMNEDVKESTTQESTPTPTLTPTPVETKSKSELKVSVLNGSGKVGVAGTLKSELEGIKFEDITTGNADSYDYLKTQVSFSDSVSQEIKDEVIKLLTKLYGGYEDASEVSAGVDVKIIIGSQKVTSSPTITPTVKP